MKLDRAEHHLEDIRAEIALIGEPGPYSRQIRIEQQDDPQWPFGYFLDLEDRPDSPLAVMIGDFLFNVRSALDHVVVASVPANRQGDAMFPIYTSEPAKQPTSKKAKTVTPGCVDNAWRRATKGMSADVLAFVERCQPHDQARRDGSDPKDHVLAVLADLQNTDKHRTLNIVARGLRDIVITVTDGDEIETRSLADVPRDHFFSNHARILQAVVQVEVEIVGSLAVAVVSGPQGLHREIPEGLDDILRAARLITNEIAKRARL
jgi:hypothetical protein